MHINILTIHINYTVLQRSLPTVIVLKKTVFRTYDELVSFDEYVMVWGIRRTKGLLLTFTVSV